MASEKAIRVLCRAELTPLSFVAAVEEGPPRPCNSVGRLPAPPADLAAADGVGAPATHSAGPPASRVTTDLACGPKVAIGASIADMRLASAAVHIAGCGFGQRSAALSLARVASAVLFLSMSASTLCRQRAGHGFRAGVERSRAAAEVVGGTDWVCDLAGRMSRARLRRWRLTGQTGPKRLGAGGLFRVSLRPKHRSSAGPAAVAKAPQSAEPRRDVVGDITAAIAEGLGSAFTIVAPAEWPARPQSNQVSVL